MSKRYAAAKAIQTSGSFGKIEGATCDVGTANLFCMIYEAISPANQAKFDSIPMAKLTAFAWQHGGFGK